MVKRTDKQFTISVNDKDTIVSIDRVKLAYVASDENITNSIPLKPVEVVTPAPVTRKSEPKASSRPQRRVRFQRSYKENRKYTKRQ